MFGRSSNAMKAMLEVQRIKNGGTARLSYSQIVCLICNTQDAQKNLNHDEFEIYKTIFSVFRGRTMCETVDINGYYTMCDIIIEQFEKYIPFLLIDGEHSENLEIRNQIKIRKLFADGVKFKEALMKYENDYNSIPIYKDYDPIKDPEAKRVFSFMEMFITEVSTKCLVEQKRDSGFGALSGAADAIYLIISDRFGSIDNKEEQAITLYNMVALGIYGFSDNDIHAIMEERKAVSSQIFQELHANPTAQMLEGILRKLSSKLQISGNEENVLQMLATYFNSIYELITKRANNV